MAGLDQGSGIWKRLSSRDMLEPDCVSIFELCDASDWKYFIYGSRKKVQSPEKQKLIAEHCDNWGPPRLDKAFANAKIESLQNASIVLDVPCFKIYSDKEPQKSAE